MKANNEKKAEQLGMPAGTASNRLRKKIIFQLLKESGKNFCFQCGAEIESEKELSIEHKKPWLDSGNPVDLFFDLDNIGFSHLSCNSGAARQTKERGHNIATYRRYGCRCDVCVAAKKEIDRKYK